MDGSELAALLKQMVATGETWRITNVINSPGTNGAEVVAGAAVAPLAPGHLLQVGELIRTNASSVEIRDNKGLILRLGPSSEIALEATPGGLVPVFYGEIYKMRHAGWQIEACAKYRTSCYVQCTARVFIRPEASAPNLDTFYSLFEETLIWEYDEQGRRFPIVIVPEGYKATLAYLDQLPMRERYTVASLEKITDEEFDYITTHYMNPKNWR